MPLPHESLLVERGVRNPTLDWGLMRELDAGGVRVESHGIAHRPLAEVVARRGRARDRGLEAEARGAARPPGARVRVREGLRGALPPGAREHPQAGRLRDRLHVDLARRTAPQTNPFRLGRYNVEPYPARTFELVLAGACDLIALKDTVAGTHARRLFNQALGTSHVA